MDVTTFQEQKIISLSTYIKIYVLNINIFFNINKLAREFGKIDVCLENLIEQFDVINVGAFHTNLIKAEEK